MIDDSCEVPREDLDDGFNPCRKQVVENGELCQYAHMYDVMNERYDREEDTSYLNSVKRDRINQSTPKQTADGGKLYAQDAHGVEGFVKSSGTLDPTTNAEIPSSKAVADYAPIPLPISKGGTGGNTPYVTDDLDSSANFVMYDEQNARYNAAPMTSLMGYLNNRYSALVPANYLSSGSDLDGLVYGTYYTSNADASNSLVNIPNHTFQSSVRVEQFANGAVTDTKAQVISENSTGTTFYRSAVNGVWNPWNQLYPTPAPTVPDKFSYAVSPFPADDWEGEMNINVAPVFTATIGSVTYVVARVYGSKKFNYTGTADNINLFSSLKPVGDYTSIFSGSTDIPLTLSVSGRSYTAGTYGLTPNVSGSNLSLNNQIVSSMINLGRFNISTNLKCVFGEGTNTPGVTVSVNCMALMWHSVS
jgi:hypothetical protein